MMTLRQLAAEPLTLPGPSKETEEMMKWLLDDWYAQLAEQVGQARGKDAAAGRAWLEKGPYTATQAAAAADMSVFSAAGPAA